MSLDPDHGLAVKAHETVETVGGEQLDAALVFHLVQGECHVFSLAFVTQGCCGALLRVFVLVFEFSVSFRNATDGTRPCVRF